MIPGHFREDVGLNMTFSLVFTLLIMGGARAFFPNRLTSTDIGEDTYTHQDISEIGILKAVAAFFEDNPRTGSEFTAGQLSDIEDITAMKLFNQYYGDEVTGVRLQEVIDTIVSANNLVYKEHFEEAVWHCNGESIRQANYKMIELREQIIEVLINENANFDLAKELIGQFLHIMQMFYSNTNWVEMFGSDAYYSLGIRDQPLFAQAPPSMMTCTSCGDSEDTSCNDTLIVNGDILTSGYRSGQDVPKPFRKPDDSKIGKCSHGGPNDKSGVTVAALGGINKDSVMPNFSPHYYLHQAAAQAAINHTTFFFNDREYGLRYIIGEAKYKQFLQLKPGTSLVLTIDYTGSMSDDIDAVKEQIIEITKLTDIVNKPSNYIVVLFNDPANLTRIFQSEDSNETLNYIQSIKVSGGGDCPEYSLDGIEKALQVCNPNSQMYIFTDAPAKDEEKFPFVVNLSIQKNVALLFFLTAGCDRRRRDTTYIQDTRDKRSTNKEDLYRALAAATGGSVYETSKAGISKLANVIKETATASVTILESNLPSTGSPDINITIDNTVRQLTIELTGSDILSEEIFNPSGNIQTSNVNVTDLGVGKLIKIYDPTPGVWKLTRLDSNPWTVEVTAQSTLDISSTFVQMDPKTGFEYEIIGHPVAGENATIVLFVPSKDLINTVDRILLLDSDGGEIVRYDKLTMIDSRGDAQLFKLRFPLPTQDFKVAVSGEDTDGKRYTRLQKKKIAPVSTQLYLLPTNGKLHINEILAIHFVVVNKGGTATTINVTINDDQNFAQSPNHRQYKLDPNQNATGQFTLRGGQASDIITTVTVSANAGSSTGDRSQFVIKRFSTQKRDIQPVDFTPPVCNITSITGSCDVIMLDSCACSKYKWSGSVDIGDEGFGLYQITSSIKDGVHFNHDPFSAGHTINNGTVKATIKSDCCNPLTYITIVDLASNTGQCVFNLAPGLETPFPECKPTKPNQLSGTTLTIIAATAGGGALIIIFIAVAIVCVVAKSKKRIKDERYNNMD